MGKRGRVITLLFELLTLFPASLVGLEPVAGVPVTAFGDPPDAILVDNRRREM